jgi:hypothetical protein
VHAALLGIAERVAPDHRERIVAILLESFPRATDDPAVGPDPHASLARATLSVCESVRAALGKLTGRELPELPKTWEHAERTGYLAALRDTPGSR